MDDGTDGWKASRKTTMTSFTIWNYLCKAYNIWGKYEGNKKGRGGGNIIKLINLHLLYCYSYLFLTFSK
jgi:hypothetical protein